MKRIVMLYPELIPSVRLCGYEQFTCLAQQGILSFDAYPLRTVTSDDLKDADAVVFSRGDSFFENYLSKKLKKAGKYLIYMLDDDLLNIPDYLASSAHYSQRAIRKNIQSIMKRCDCFMTPSENLARKYGKLFDAVVMIEEPALSCTKRTAGSCPVKIGFAGSVDRTLDFEQILAQPLRNIKNTFGDAVSIEFVGIQPPVAQELGSKCHPYAKTYADYQQTMSRLGWDIGLAPMPDTAFHACKHYNKFIEYGSYGIISVCSDLPPYTRVIQNWENGVLCPNNGDAWEEALVKLIQDPQLRNSIAERLYQQISGSFLVPEVARRLWEQLDGHIPVLQSHVMGSLASYYRMLEVKGKVKMLLVQARHHGWRLPLVMVKWLLHQMRRLISWLLRPVRRALRPVKHFVKRLLKRDS